MLEQALLYAPDIKTRYYAQLKGDQIMQDNDLFSYEEVLLDPPLRAIISRPGLRSKCQRCGEEIINARQVIEGNEIFCVTCAGAGYYRPEALP